MLLPHREGKTHDPGGPTQTQRLVLHCLLNWLILNIHFQAFHMDFHLLIIHPSASLFLETWTPTLPVQDGGRGAGMEGQSITGCTRSNFEIQIYVTAYLWTGGDWSTQRKPRESAGTCIPCCFTFYGSFILCHGNSLHSMSWYVCLKPEPFSPSGGTDGLLGHPLLVGRWLGKPLETPNIMDSKACVRRPACPGPLEEAEPPVTALQLCPGRFLPLHP